MKKLVFILALLWGGGAAGYWYYTDASNHQAAFRTIAVHRGDLLTTINASGTLEPQEVVDVGAQIAGEIQSFGKDPRDPSRPIGWGCPVEVGTVLAQLDDRLFKARLDQARASLRKAEADVLAAQAKLTRAERDLDRVRKLFSKHQISAQELDSAIAEYDTAKPNLALAESSVALSKANLEEAEVNLDYTTIQSRVKGVVLDRRVNIGQTVVASLNAPSLFLIAKDLSRMEIWASVNENDVGAIHIGQNVRFTVAAFPREEFHGKVSQIRLNATMSQSVVTFTVVVEVDNTGGKLLPFLTARVQFEVDERKGVVIVPNAALRWEPKVQNVAPRARDAYAAELRQRAVAPRAEVKGTRGETRSRERATLWVRQGEFVRPVPVSLGVTDGIQTEIMGGEVHEGTEVVIGLLQPDEHDDAEAGGASPFLPKIKNNKAAR